MDMRQLRERSKLSREDVASSLGKGYSTIKNWEDGRTEPTLGVSKVLELCKLYGCSLEELTTASQASIKNKGKNSRRRRDRQS